MDAGDLGGRLPLIAPACLEVDARRLYDRLVEGRLRLNSPFVKRLDTGELIGPFNAFLYAPDIAGGFIEFHEAEERATELPDRVREIVILSVGSVWKAEYEIYAHRAVATKAGCICAGLLRAAMHRMDVAAAAALEPPRNLGTSARGCLDSRLTGFGSMNVAEAYHLEEQCS